MSLPAPPEKAVTAAARDAYYALASLCARAGEGDRPSSAATQYDGAEPIVIDPVLSRALAGAVLSSVLARYRWAHRLGGPVAERGASSLIGLLISEDPEGELCGTGGADALRSLGLEPRASAAALSVLDEGAIGGDYASLDLSQIGRVYEAIADLRVGLTVGHTVALRPGHVLVSLEGLAAASPKDRLHRVEQAMGVKLSPRARAVLGEADGIAAIGAALRARLSPRYPVVLSPGVLAVQPSGARRSQGSHFTPTALARAVVERTMAPLLARLGNAPASDEILDLRVCDPAMGAGAFLIEAGELLAHALSAARAREGGEPSMVVARRDVIPCLYGLDRDGAVVAVARRVLWLWAGAPPGGLGALCKNLRHGDALLGWRHAELIELGGSNRDRQRLVADALIAAHFGGADKQARARAVAEVRGLARAWAGGALSEPELRARIGDGDFGEMGPPFHWEVELEDVFRRPRAGFDAVIGNPPWVAYAGRAAQPLDPGIFELFVQRYRAFFGYRTLHGVFVERAAELLSPRGRLGLVLPTSVSDLDGYAPVRSAHDAICDVDRDLPDFGADSFDGVFQPAMALLSTRRPRANAPPKAAPGSPWSVLRDDLDGPARALLDRLAEMPPLPRETFGERGFQTTRDDVRHMTDLSGDSAGSSVPLREGADIAEFMIRSPRRGLDPSLASGRFRSVDEWRAIDVLIRQTARYPIAARSDGLAFRNSLLAGYASDGLDAFALCAYLNSSLVRWHHYVRYRDARQGMPQVKIGHLRSIPAPPPGLAAALSDWGRRLSERNTGIEPTERDALDEAVFAAFDLSGAHRDVVRSWGARLPR